MSEPVSRQELEVAIERLHARELTAAARAILDAPPVEWCETHGAPLNFDFSSHCYLWMEDQTQSCRFETYVLVKVEE